MLHVIYYVTRYYHALPKLSIPGIARLVDLRIYWTAQAILAPIWLLWAYHWRPSCWPSMCAFMLKTWYVLQGLGDRPTRPQRLRKLGHFRTQANFWFPLSSLKLQLSLNLSPCLPSGLYCLLPKNQLPLGRVVFLPICLCVPARIEFRHQTSVLCWTYLSLYNAKVQWLIFYRSLNIECTVAL